MFFVNDIVSEIDRSRASLVPVVAPWTKRADQIEVACSFARTECAFRAVGWLYFGVLFVTGTFNLWVRGVRFGDLGRAACRSSQFAQAAALKVGVFALVLPVSALHDFVIGSRATCAIQ